MLSIVIPALNEQHDLPSLLHDLEGVRAPHEVIVCDGGSSDDTALIAAQAGAQVVAAPRGRGHQLRAGAAVAQGDVLCFLHADTRLDEDARAALDRVVGQRADGVAYAFALRIAADAWPYRMVEWGTDARSRLAGLPYGDQGLILTRTTYDRAGGFAPLPLMEDVEFVRRLRAHSRIVTLRECVTVSARRWATDGVFKRTARNWMLLAAYSAGVAPTRLALLYRPNKPGGS